jgi:hypothetical protein
MLGLEGFGASFVLAGERCRMSAPLRSGWCVGVYARCTYLTIRKIIPLPQTPLLEIHLQYPVYPEKLAKPPMQLSATCELAPSPPSLPIPHLPRANPPHLQNRSRKRSPCLSQKPRLARYYSNYPQSSSNPKTSSEDVSTSRPSGASTPRARDQNPESPHPFVHHNARNKIV